MKTYKVIFARNEVMACLVTASNIPGGGDAHIERHHGSPIYVLVQAEDAIQATSLARTLAGTPALPRHMGEPSSDPRQ